MSETIGVPALAADASAIARIKTEIDISDRSRIVTFGERAQRSVVEFADRILAQTQNRELGNTGKLLSDILAKARGLDPAALKDAGFLTRLFSPIQFLFADLWGKRFPFRHVDLRNEPPENSSRGVA